MSNARRLCLPEWIFISLRKIVDCPGGVGINCGLQRATDAKIRSTRLCYLQYAHFSLCLLWASSFSGLFVDIRIKERRHALDLSQGRVICCPVGRDLRELENLNAMWHSGGSHFISILWQAFSTTSSRTK